MLSGDVAAARRAAFGSGTTDSAVRAFDRRVDAALAVAGNLPDVVAHVNAAAAAVFVTMYFGILISLFFPYVPSRNATIAEAMVYIKAFADLFGRPLAYAVIGGSPPEKSDSWRAAFWDGKMNFNDGRSYFKYI